MRLRGADQAFSAGLQPADGLTVVTWGFAPGYGDAGLQPALFEVL